MGLCGSGEKLSAEEAKARKLEKDKSKNIENQTKKQEAEDKKIKKLLLLGAGESGKSTLFKQMITLYGKGFSKEDKIGYVPIIYNNTITSMKTLVKQSDILDDESCRIRPEHAESKAFINDLKSDAKIDPEVAKHIQTLWADAGIQVTFEQRARYQLNDSAQYFFEQLENIKQPDYVPSDQDLLRSRVRTTGIVETNFTINGNEFKMFDVGGQRNERKKWIHCFENVTAVIFVAAMSEYDQMLYEDETQNRMLEALQLFQEICNSRWFRYTSMILFLNKSDLFSEKIQKVDLNVCFPEYTGGLDYDAGCAFLKNIFESKNQHKDTKQVYTHITCATNTENVQHVFNSVEDTIIKQSLREGGLM